MKRIRTKLIRTACLFGLTVILAGSPARADHLIYDDCIITGSLCVGFDCVNGESFGYDTIRLKENNLRIHFDDTSTAASYPRNDWRIMINDSANGGGSYFAVEDAFTARQVFKIEAGAPPNSLYVDDGGRVGLRTSTPSVELDIKDGDTPTVRLQQDGTSGFAPHTWDVAGNETNFFVRDVTDGSKLPFRIRPGSPSNSIYINQPDGDVGMGTSSPAQALHINRDTTSNVSVRIENDNADWDFRVNTVGNFAITAAGSGVNEMELEETTGNMTIIGTLTVRSGAGNQTTYPDYVFEPGYPLMPLGELAGFIEQERHLPNVLSLDDIRASKGINMTELQLQILEKVEELTLYTIQQQSTIETLTQRLAELEARPE